MPFHRRKLPLFRMARAQKNQDVLAKTIRTGVKRSSAGRKLKFEGHGLADYESGFNRLPGSTNNQAKAPQRHSAAATRKAAVQPNREAIHGVSEAVIIPPI